MRKLWLFSLLFLLSSSMYAQRTVSGNITSASDGGTLPGVNIMIKGTSAGTVSSFDGDYTIEVPDGAATLVYSFIGFGTQEVVVGNQTVINIALSEDSELVDEVVVTALGIKREKKSLGYAVSEIDGSVFSDSRESNPVNSLSGRVAGVVISSSGSGAGGSSRVVIRGNNSLSGNNQPLYVVDGIPIDNSGFGSSAGVEEANWSKYDYGTGVSDINPDDIESMSVLKGPNAAALYGSRAANGVILITTKQGSKDKGIGVTINSSLTFSNPMILPEYQNTFGQGRDGISESTIEELRGNSSSWGSPLDGTNRLYWDGTQRAAVAENDNVKDFFETGRNYINTLSLDGGNKTSSFRFSYTNNRSDAMLPNSKVESNNFNLRGTSELSDKLSVDAKATYFKQIGENRPNQGEDAVIGNVYTMPRNTRLSDLEKYANITDIYNRDNAADYYASRSYTDKSGNPYWTFIHDSNNDTRERFGGFVKLNYEFNDKLSALARIGTDVVHQSIDQITNYGHWQHFDGEVNHETYRTSETNADFLVNYKDYFADEKISFNASFGGNIMRSQYEKTRQHGEVFRVPTFPTLGGTERIISEKVPLKQKEVQSLYLSTSFGYRNMLYLDLTARNDWSSTLNPNNRSYAYPSVNTSFIVSELLENKDVFSYIKLRAGWAKVGNDTDAYANSRLYYEISQDGYLGGLELTRPSTMPNYNLKPESTESIELGLEFKLFKNRLYGDFSWYNIESRDLIMDVPISQSTGYSKKKDNVGLMTNQGFEFMLGGTIISQKDMEWDASVNFAKNENKLVELIEGVDDFMFSSVGNESVRVQATVGAGFGDIYGKDWKRNEEGQLILNAAGIPEVEENVYLGNYQPDWTAGFSNSFRYKSFSIRMLIDARVGGDVYVGTQSGLDAAGVSAQSLQYRSAENPKGGVVIAGVQNIAKEGETPVYQENNSEITASQYWGAYAGIHSNYVQESTNVRLREIGVSYTIPSKVFGSDSFVKSASIGFTARNLCFLYNNIEGYDPELSYSSSNFGQGVLRYNLPSTRDIGFNINLKF